MILKSIFLIIMLASSSSYAKSVYHDKYLHVGASSVIGFVSQSAFDSRAKSYAACMSVGIAKETYDYHNYGLFDLEDLGSDLVGCAIGIELSKQLGFTIFPSQEDDITMLNISIPL